jgi:hypothetical protein
MALFSLIALQNMALFCLIALHNMALSCLIALQNMALFCLIALHNMALFCLTALHNMALSCLIALHNMTLSCLIALGNTYQLCYTFSHFMLYLPFPYPLQRLVNHSSAANITTMTHAGYRTAETRCFSLIGADKRRNHRNSFSVQNIS